MLIDTGSDINLCQGAGSKTGETIHLLDGNTLHTGSRQVTVEGQQVQFATTRNAPWILGKPGIIQFGLSFRDGLWSLGPERGIKCDLDLQPDTAPSRRYTPRLSKEIGDKIATTIAELQAAGTIESTTSAWNSPIMPVPKPDGRVRLTVDYRAVNRACTGDAFPLPRMLDQLQALPGRFFCKIDLKNGYWHVPMGRGRHLTAFDFRGAQYAWNKMPQGLSIGPAVFHRYMAAIVPPRPWLVQYFDDIVVAGNTHAECANHRDEILLDLSQHGMIINTAKSILDPINSLTMCGYQITADGITVPEATQEHLRLATPPRNQREVRQFIGKLQHHRRLFPNLATTCQFLSAKLKADCPFTWSSANQAAWHRLKQQLLTPKTLTRAYTGDLTIETDASECAISGLLRASDHRIVDTFSRSLNAQEARWPIWQKEMLALYEAVNRFGHLLGSRPIRCRIDNAVVVAKVRSGRPAGSRDGKWLELLNRYALRPEWLSTTDNKTADELSRAPALQELYESTHSDALQRAQESTIAQFYHKRRRSLSTPSTGDAPKEGTQGEAFTPVTGVPRHDTSPPRSRRRLASATP